MWVELMRGHIALSVQIHCTVEAGWGQVLTTCKDSPHVVFVLFHIYIEPQPFSSSGKELYNFPLLSLVTDYIDILPSSEHKTSNTAFCESGCLIYHRSNYIKTAQLNWVFWCFKRWTFKNYVDILRTFCFILVIQPQYKYVVAFTLIQTVAKQEAEQTWRHKL